MNIYIIRPNITSSVNKFVPEEMNRFVKWTPDGVQE